MSIQQSLLGAAGSVGSAVTNITGQIEKEKKATQDKYTLEVGRAERYDRATRALSTKLTKLSTRYNSLTQGITDTQNEVNAMNETMNDYDKRKHGLQTAYGIEQANKNRSGRLGSLQAGIDKYVKSIGQLQIDVAGKETSIGQFKTLQEGLLKEIEQVKASLNTRSPEGSLKADIDARYGK